MLSVDNFNNTYGYTYMSEALAEERVLMVCIIGTLLILPMKVFEVISTPMYGLLIALELLYLVVSSKRIRRSELDLGLLAVAGAFLLFMLGRWIGGGFEGGDRMLQTLLFLLTLIVFSRYKWNRETLHLLFKVFALLMVACLVCWVATGRVSNYYKAFYGHSNGFALVIVAAIAVTLLDCCDGVKVRHILVLSLSAILLIFANSRSALLTVGVLLLSSFWLIKRRREGIGAAGRVMFIALVVGALFFSVAYPSLYGTDLGRQLELLSREYLNKNFFSGRQIVWKIVLDAISGNEVVGLGLQYTPSLIYSTSLSCHNLYLQTMLQIGFVGLILLILLLWTVLGRFSRYGGAECCIGASLLLGMLVHECLEVSLTQNNFTYGLFIWAIFGICLAFGSHQKGQLARDRHLNSLNDRISPDAF